MVSCTLISGYRFSWYGLASGCSYISKILFFQVPNVTWIRNLYLVNRLWRFTRSYSVKCLLSDAILHRLYIYHLRCNIWVSCHPVHVRSPVVIFSEKLVFKTMIWRVEVNFSNIFCWVCTSFVCASIYPNCILGEA